MSRRVSMIRQDQSSCSIIRTMHQRLQVLDDSEPRTWHHTYVIASVSTIDKAINSSDASALCHYYLLDTLWDSLLSSTSKVYINPSVVALRIQLVLSAFLPLCVLWSPSSGPWIKGISLGSLQYNSQVCMTCLCIRRVVLQLQAHINSLYFSSS